MTPAVKDGIAAYDNITFEGKVLLLTEGCWGLIPYYGVDYCQSLMGAFQFCSDNGFTCKVHLIGSRPYVAEDFPCRCGVSVPLASCSMQGIPACSYEVAPVPVEVNTSCLQKATAQDGASADTTTTTAQTFAEANTSAVQDGPSANTTAARLSTSTDAATSTVKDAAHANTTTTTISTTTTADISTLQDGIPPSAASSPRSLRWSSLFGLLLSWRLTT